MARTILITGAGSALAKDPPLAWRSRTHRHRHRRVLAAGDRPRLRHPLHNGIDYIDVREELGVEGFAPAPG